MTDWKSIRRGFPVTENCVYLMNAGTTPLNRRVLDAYRSHVEEYAEMGCPGWKGEVESLKACRENLARLIGSEAKDIGFAPNTSMGINYLAMMTKDAFGVGEVVIPEDDFPASVTAWYHHGFDVRLVPSHQGKIHVSDLLDAIGEKTKAVVTSHVQFFTGFRLGLEELGREVKKRGLPFFVNATQSLGAFSVNVNDIHADALLASSHKWMGGGFGSSVFYISPEFRSKTRWPIAGWFSVKEPMEMKNQPPDLKEDASEIETGMIPLTTLRGLRAAAENVLEIGVDEISQRILENSTSLEKSLRSIGAELISPRDEGNDFRHSVNSGIVTFRAEKPDEIVEALASRNIFVSARRGAVRVSIHYYNDQSDIDRFIEGYMDVKGAI